MPRKSRALFWLRVCACSALLSFPLLASELNAELRHHSETTQRNLLDETLLYRKESGMLPGVELAARLQQSTSDIESASYAAGLGFSPLPFTVLGLRLSHAGYLSDTTSLTHLLGTFTLRVPFRISPFATLGWYKRWALLQNMTLIPTFRHSYTEHDFALSLGCGLQWSDNFSTEFLLSTYEDIDVFNLNNPYAQIKLIFTPKGSPVGWYFLGRYKVLLGFGRLDSFTAGAGLSLKL